MQRRLPLAVAASLLLAACGQSGSEQHAAPPSTATASSRDQSAMPATTARGAVLPSGMQRFHSVRLDFYIDYPASMASSVLFDSKYLANDHWKTYAGPETSGTPVLMLTLPGSNEVTAGELRIGIASDAGEVRRCDQLPDAAKASSRDKVDINGTTFVTYEAADAGMSHYLKVHSYRVVHGGYCFAIDLLVTGTNPKVYSPPRTPPFSQDEAFAKLHKALQGFHFTR